MVNQHTKHWGLINDHAKKNNRCLLHKTTKQAEEVLHKHTKHQLNFQASRTNSKKSTKQRGIVEKMLDKTFL